MVFYIYIYWVGKIVKISHQPYITRKCCITILYHAMENTVGSAINATYAQTKNATHDGKVGCNAVEYTTAFLHSDLLYFLCRI